MLRGGVGLLRRHLPAIPARQRLPGAVTGSGVPGTDPDDLTEDGHNFLDRHAELGDMQALHRAVPILEDALSQVRGETEDYALVADNLALALRDAAAATG